ncbi:MAG: beta-ketoacyl synthase chain length factor, partial [Bacteroidetes bacterium]|nr:beta-ketoacyl synthase chain length factor [Bacteroidota bacterium]
MELYINGIGVLSAAGISSTENFPSEILGNEAAHLTCQEPDYREYIPPMQLRRMSKAVRMGIGSAKLCLADAFLQKPDALSVGTALGCLHDTEIFLSKMVEQNEQMLSPTAFIQSTHNTVAGQIALLTGSNGHNLTFAHRGHSFEHALLNAKLYL